MPPADTLSGHAVVYFGNDWFAENRTSSHHIARRLGARFPLLYIEVPGLRAPAASARDFSKLWRKLANSVRPPSSIGPHMWHMTLPQIPFRGLPGATAMNHAISGFLVRRALRHLGFQRIISWFLVPHPGFLAGKLGETLTVFYAIDNYSALPGVDPVRVAQMDEELSRRAHVVFAVSPALVEAKKKLNSHVVFSPHGVDAELFGRAADKSLPLPDRLKGLSHPVIGFFGVLDTRVDISLLQYLARQRPDWNFVLVGRIATDVGGLSNLKNVLLTGAVPYETVPDWARAFDVCLMPYFQDSFSVFANPLKMREYLATGCPVVSVPTPEVERFGESVAVARSHEQFLELIERELKQDSEERRRARQKSVAPMTWDARVEEIVGHAAQALRRVAPGSGS